MSKYCRHWALRPESKNNFARWFCTGLKWFRESWSTQPFTPSHLLNTLLTEFSLKSKHSQKSKYTANSFCCCCSHFSTVEVGGEGGACWAVILFDSFLCIPVCASAVKSDTKSYVTCLLYFLRNWYVDEPSCGSEICVVMYHQPSAPPGVGGPYMFQWNDDRCNMKNNFICKYALGNESFRSFKNQPAPNPQEDVWGDGSNR